MMYIIAMRGSMATDEKASLTPLPSGTLIAGLHQNPMTTYHIVEYVFLYPLCPQHYMMMYM